MQTFESLAEISFAKGSDDQTRRQQLYDMICKRSELDKEAKIYVIHEGFDFFRLARLLPISNISVQKLNSFCVESTDVVSKNSFEKNVLPFDENGEIKCSFVEIDRPLKTTGKEREDLWKQLVTTGHPSMFQIVSSYFPEKFKPKVVFGKFFRGSFINTHEIPQKGICIPLSDQKFVLCESWVNGGIRVLNSYYGAYENITKLHKPERGGHLEPSEKQQLLNFFASSYANKPIKKLLSYQQCFDRLQQEPWFARFAEFFPESFYPNCMHGTRLSWSDGLLLVFTGKEWLVHEVIRCRSIGSCDELLGYKPLGIINYLPFGKVNDGKTLEVKVPMEVLADSKKEVLKPYLLPPINQKICKQCRRV